MALVFFTFKDYAISNDEEVQQRYGEMIVAYYATGFADQALFHFRDLYLYGGLFDLAAVGLEKLLPLDTYAVRHLLTALIGLGGAHLHWLSLTLLVLGVLFMDAAVQSSNLLGQSVIYELLPEARSRLTAIYMTTMFIGGALGSWAAAHAYQRWGWTGACVAAAAFPAAGLLCWLAARRHEVRES